MEIKREIDLKNATYDITGLTHEQFTMLFRCYEKQMIILCNERPDNDALYTKMAEMVRQSVVIV